MTRRLSWILLLLTLVLWSGAPATAEDSPGDQLFNRLLASEPSQWDAALSAGGTAVDDGLIDRLQRTSISDLSRGNKQDARRHAELADYVDYFHNGKKEYNGLAQVKLILALLQAQDRPLATEIGSAMVDAYPDSFNAHFVLGVVDSSRSTAERAVTEFKAAIRLRPTSLEAHYRLAINYGLLEDAAQARQAFEDCLKINPNYGPALDAMAIINGKTPSQNASRVNPEATRHFNAAEELFQEQKYSQAIEEYKKAAQADPKFAKPLIFMGDAYFAMGDRPHAIECYQKAITVDPKDRQAHRFLGDLYEKWFDESGDVKYLDLAITCYQNSVNADPSYQTSVQDLARARRKRAAHP